MTLPKSGDVLHLGRKASVQFNHPILFRVIRIHDWTTSDGWVWLDGYQLNVAGDAVERRSVFVQIAGLRWIPKAPDPRNRNTRRPAIPRQRTTEPGQHPQQQAVTDAEAVPVAVNTAAPQQGKEPPSYKRRHADMLVPKALRARASQLAAKKLKGDLLRQTRLFIQNKSRLVPDIEALILRLEPLPDADRQAVTR